jgi:peptide/nickel transport system substrate-binding protein
VVARTRILSVIGVAGALLLSSGGLSALSQAASPPFVTAVGSWPPLAVLNPFSPNAVPSPDGLVTAYLAYFVNGNQSFVPELAQSWAVKQKSSVANDAVVTLHLRPHARWSNGTPITAADVKMSLEIGYIFNYQLNGYIQSITTPNAHTVIVRQSGTPFNLFVRDLLTSAIYPASQWKKYIPADVATLYRESEGSGPKAAQASSTLARLAKTMAAVNIPIAKYISGGPFNYQSVTSDEIVVTKNPDWWGARNVHVQTINILASSGNSEFYSYALSGRTDLMSTFAPPSVINPFVARRGNHLIAPPGNYGPALQFNTSVKPFNNVAVRQAFAYIINRTEAEKIAYPSGTSSVSGGSPVVYPSGLPVAYYAEYLSAATRKALNPYRHNLARAAKLLVSAGLKKSHGQWMYDGKPFSVYIACPSGYSDWVAISENIATQLKLFGINASLRSVDTTTYFTEIPTGAYPVALNFVGSSAPGPWYDYASVMGDEGLTVNGTGVVSRIKTSYNWGPVISVKGVGSINVVKVWNNMLQTNNKAQLIKDTDELALAINQQLPLIDILYNKVFGIFYNTSTYNHFPAASSPLWTDWIGGQLNFEAMVMGMGYIKPAR